MKTKRVKCFTAVSLTIILMTAAAYAAVANQFSYVEKFETDKVDIRLEELSAIDSGETAATEGIIAANKDVSYIPRIENKGADCYLRAKVEVSMDGECRDPLGVEDLYGIDDDWILRGDYLYYTKVLPEGEKVDVFKGIHIPEYWEYDQANGFAIKVRAEAIQSANFNADFREELPWGSVSLQSVGLARTMNAMEAVPVNYVSDAEYTSDGGFQCDSSDLFEGFSGMMPGDCYERTVNIKNSADNPLHLSLKVTSGDNELNKKINIKISAENREIYAGTAAGVNMLDVIDLAEVQEGNTGTVSLQMSLPADAGNAYAELADDIIWELSAEELVDKSVQTGDDFKMPLFVIIAVIALMVLIVLIICGRRGRYETTH